MLQYSYFSTILKIMREKKNIRGTHLQYRKRLVQIYQHALPRLLHAAPATRCFYVYWIIILKMAPNAFACLDNIIIVIGTFEKHLENLAEIFQRLRKHGSSKILRNTILYGID